MIFFDSEPFEQPIILPKGTMEKWVANHPQGHKFSIMTKVPAEITSSVQYNNKLWLIPCGSTTNVVGLVCVRYDKKEVSKGTPFNIDSWMLYGGAPECDLLFRLKKSAMGPELHKASTVEGALDNAKFLLEKYGVEAWRWA